MSAISNLEALAVKCKACECVQQPSIKCRRCGKALPYLQVEVIQPKELPPEPMEPLPLPMTLRQARAQAIREALIYSHGDMMRAAKLLGTGKTSLYRWRTKFPNWFQIGDLDAK